MQVETATPETGPVDAPATAESIAEEIAGGGEAPLDGIEAVTEELVKEAEGQAGEPSEEPGAEDDATKTPESPEETEGQQPDEQSYTVKVNGEERQVPLSELLNGYSRTEDYKA